MQFDYWAGATENAGWDEDCNVQWSLDSYPDDVAEMLIDHDNNSSDDELDVIEDDNLDELDEDENFIDSFWIHVSCIVCSYFVS